MFAGVFREELKHNDATSAIFTADMLSRINARLDQLGQKTNALTAHDLRQGFEQALERSGQAFLERFDGLSARIDELVSQGEEQRRLLGLMLDRLVTEPGPQARMRILSVQLGELAQELKGHGQALDRIESKVEGCAPRCVWP